MLGVAIDVVNARCYCPFHDTVELDPCDLVYHRTEVVGVAQSRTILVKETKE